MDAWKNARDITLIGHKVDGVAKHLELLEERLVDLNSRLHKVETSGWFAKKEEEKKPVAAKKKKKSGWFDGISKKKEESEVS